ncbi:putative phage tail assembly chaperone [Microbulbifer thermotolerans]|uniref:putative phage tail assembly chaperone n=1 Tax=Microbulbifer thermotolerans TaxID=252514 RepID=UPI00224ABC95|nr:putative phage tail assembly chaperone [Microbulbifer thermotolerans]MCX2834455.1 putative phage tail assembly chaperone [Microbulbifer thermotolerans]
MAAKSNSNQQTIELTIGDKEITFEVTREQYNKLINKLGPNQKVAPMHNFLVETVRDEDKPALLEILANYPGSEVDICGELMEAYSPDLQIAVKKRSG